MDAKKILLVEDDKVVCTALSNKLQASHYEVICASDPVEALETAREQHPDLVIVDLGLPSDAGCFCPIQWDGIQVMEWFNQTSDHLTPFIVVTGEGTQNRDRAMRSGATEFFQKPVSSQQLLETVKKAIGESEA